MYGVLPTADTDFPIWRCVRNGKGVVTGLGPPLKYNACIGGPQGYMPRTAATRSELVLDIAVAPAAALAAGADRRMSGAGSWLGPGGSLGGGPQAAAFGGIARSAHAANAAAAADRPAVPLEEVVRVSTVVSAHWANTYRADPRRLELAISWIIRDRNRVQAVLGEAGPTALFQLPVLMPCSAMYEPMKPTPLEGTLARHRVRPAALHARRRAA